MTDFANKVSFENVRAIRDSGKALLCVIDGAEVWVPHSQIDDDSQVYQAGHEGTLVISEWLATAKGLI